MSALELRAPEEWATIYGVTIMDPDGWREDGLDWNAPIDEVTFRRLEMRSTTAPRPRPVLVHSRAEHVVLPKGAYNVDRRGMPWSIARVDDVRRCAVFVTDHVADHFMAGFAYGYGLKVVAIMPALANANDLDGVVRVDHAAQASQLLENYVRTFQ